jgi:hypothetical protein
MERGITGYRNAKLEIEHDISPVGGCMRPDANTTWFAITTQSGDFAVYSFSGKEEV